MISDEEPNSLAAFVDGMPTPSPPSLAGRAKRVRSWSLGGGVPIRPGGELSAELHRVVPAGGQYLEQYGSCMSTFSSIHV